MRHGNKVNHLGRKTGHLKAMLSNMACSLLEHKRITTTLAKAKSLRVFVEPILTKSKNDSTHSRRLVFSDLQNKEVVTELFRDIAPKIASRNGGYTRIIRTGSRLGDNAEMCMIELVDFNEIYTNEKAKKTTRRSRRGGSTTNTSSVTEETVVEDAVTEETVVEDAVTEETSVEDAVVEETVVEEAIVEETVLEDAVVEETVLEDAVVEDAVVEEAIVEETVVEDIVTEETNTDDPNSESPIEDSSEEEEDKKEEN